MISINKLRFDNRDNNTLNSCDGTVENTAVQSQKAVYAYITGSRYCFLICSAEYNS